MLPSTPTHFNSFLTHPHSFSGHSYPLPLICSPLLLILFPLPPMCSLSHPFPLHIQVFSPSPAHHLPFQPIFSPCVLSVYVLKHLRAHVSSCFTCPCAYVIHFYALYCLCLYTLRTFVCVNTSGLFIYTAFLFKLFMIFIQF